MPVETTDDFAADEAVGVGRAPDANDQKEQSTDNLNDLVKRTHDLFGELQVSAAGASRRWG